MSPEEIREARFLANSNWATAHAGHPRSTPRGHPDTYRKPVRGQEHQDAHAVWRHADSVREHSLDNASSQGGNEPGQSHPFSGPLSPAWPHGEPNGRRCHCTVAVTPGSKLPTRPWSLSRHWRKESLHARDARVLRLAMKLLSQCLRRFWVEHFQKAALPGQFALFWVLKWCT